MSAEVDRAAAPRSAPARCSASKRCSRADGARPPPGPSPRPRSEGDSVASSTKRPLSSHSIALAWSNVLSSRVGAGARSIT
jgi:hypothetical protein